VQITKGKEKCPYHTCSLFYNFIKCMNRYKRKIYLNRFFLNVGFLKNRLINPVYTGCTVRTNQTRKISWSGFSQFIRPVRSGLSFIFITQVQATLSTIGNLTSAPLTDTARYQYANKNHFKEKHPFPSNENSEQESDVPTKQCSSRKQ
jgi:hypothetical protein